MAARISIISVNYNGFALTCAMIDSLACISTQLEIVVIDNGSKRDEAAMLAARYPHIHVVRSEANLGFAGGNNLGVGVATGEYLFFLNNDTEIKQDTLHYLCDRLDRDPKLGVICPKIRFFTPPQLIQFAGYTPLTRITLRNALIGFKQQDNEQFNTPTNTPYAHGAAMMVRRAAITKAGLMPEIYFLYYEELDWSVRITEAGFNIAYEPRSTIFHKESATTGQQSPLRGYYLTRNRLLFAWRNRRGVECLLAIAYQLGIVLPKSLLVALLQRRIDLFSATLRGVGDFITLKNKCA